MRVRRELNDRAELLKPAWKAELEKINKFKSEVARFATQHAKLPSSIAAISAQAKNLASITEGINTFAQLMQQPRADEWLASALATVELPPVATINRLGAADLDQELPSETSGDGDLRSARKLIASFHRLNSISLRLHKRLIGFVIARRAAVLLSV